MSLRRIKIENFKSIKYCDISINELNMLIGANGSGKTNILESIKYFYNNLTTNEVLEDIYDGNNKYNNWTQITLFFDLSEFVKISKSHTDIFVDDDSSEEIKYENYYKAILSLASKNDNNIIPLRLMQIKGKGIRWNLSYEERTIIKSLFPFFYIDTRNLDITKWSYIWDILAEISKVSNSERILLESRIHELIESNVELSKKIKGIKDIFDSSNVNIKETASKEFAKILSNIYFSGEIIYQKGKQLEYYSTGTNSVKYIELLLKSITELAKTKLKEPIILLDEPEISLHPNFIDELSYAIMDINPRISVLISTHSSRLVKNVLSIASNVCLYNVKLQDSYTYIQHMKNFPQYSPNSKYRVTDEHVNSYFSSSILFVEGESELELFSNPYLKLLYPKLKKVDVFQAMTQKLLLNIMHPNKVKTNIPFLCLIDMDKVLRYNINTKKLELQTEYLKKNDKEKFAFRNKKDKGTYLYHHRIRIDKMAKLLHIHYLKPYYSCLDDMYYKFLESLKEYLLRYNIFAFNTTIEGALINSNTYDYAMLYIKSNNKETEYEAFKKYIDSLPITDRINVLRLVFKGKTDLLQDYAKTIKEKIDPSISIIIDRIMVKKASGWITKFINDFFEQNVDIQEELTPKRFERYLEDPDNKLYLTKMFQNNFPEIYSLITKIMI